MRLYCQSFDSLFCYRKSENLQQTQWNSDPRGSNNLFPADSLCDRRYVLSKDGVCLRSGLKVFQSLSWPQQYYLGAVAKKEMLLAMPRIQRWISCWQNDITIPYSTESAKKVVSRVQWHIETACRGAESMKGLADVMFWTLQHLFLFLSVRIKTLDSSVGSNSPLRFGSRAAERLCVQLFC